LWCSERTELAKIRKEEKIDQNWQSWEFLVGEWVGDGTGIPGQASGGLLFISVCKEEFSFERVMPNTPRQQTSLPSATTI
jgi:hypothetical protein